jgi:hypothetical protein
MQIIKNQFTPAHAINIVSFSDTSYARRIVPSMRPARAPLKFKTATPARLLGALHHPRLALFVS